MSGTISVTSAIILTNLDYPSHKKLPLSGYILMKFIVGLSSLALFSISSISPSLAATELVNSSANQSLPSTAKTIQEANSFTQVIHTADRQQKLVAQRANREQWFQQRRYRAQEAARVRQAAAAARRERERRYFESLTPEQQRQYIAQKRARQEQQARQMLLLLGILGAATQYGNSGASSQQTQDYYYIQNPSTPSYNSASPTKYESGFYGNCHSYDCPR
jgi:hypothetical protein